LPLNVKLFYTGMYKTHRQMPEEKLTKRTDGSHKKLCKLNTEARYVIVVAVKKE
jgi:hypothetical protein